MGKGEEGRTGKGKGGEGGEMRGREAEPSPLIGISGYSTNCTCALYV